ncbi:MAG: CbtB domain-containing protein [Sedimentitalea sp.]|uniref:CbtB domain-containing protein n=1 Tax=Sedimentitalea sp. TaxID=2048915 RepID=UPI0032676CAE
MTIQTLNTTIAKQNSLVAPIICLMLGCGIIFLSGHVQASALHDAAHDVRHATGFPCH